MDLSINQMTDISSLNKLTLLEKLYLSNNRVKEIYSLENLILLNPKASQHHIDTVC